MRMKLGSTILATVAALGFAVLPAMPKTETITASAYTVDSIQNKMDLGNYWAFWTDWDGAKDTTLSSSTKETYDPMDRLWSGLPTVCLTEGGRLWAGFMTGGHLEPDKLNYNAFHYSDDGGLTWSEESLVIEHKDAGMNLYQPHLFMVDGVMHLWLNNAGQNAIQIPNPDCENPSQELQLSKAKKVLNRNAAHRPTILSEKWDNIWLFSAENSNDSANAIFASTNGEKWEQYSSVESTNGARRWWEAQIIEAADGTLIHMSRLEEGADDGMQLAYSYDGGETWTETQASNGRPFTSYSNKSHMQRLDSGNLLLIVGCSTSARENLTAFLSEDNGKTWPYSLSLDARKPNEWFGCGYPEAANLQGPNGEIYVVWDSRESFREIGCAKFTEADIKAGKIVTKDCYTYGNVLRNANANGFIYKDISGVVEKFTREYSFELGTEKDQINDVLPDKLTAVYGDDDKQVTMIGMWTCPDFNPNVAGRYTFRFDSPDMPSGYGDSYGHLLVTVNLGNPNAGEKDFLADVKEKLGCNSSVGMMPVMAAAFSMALVLKKKNKKY